MNIEAIIEQIDAEISKLQQAKVLLNGATATSSKRGPGRPKVASVTSSSVAPTPAKRVMSAEGKAKIAQAQKARWAKSRRAAKKAAKTVAPAKAVKSISPAKS